MELGSDSTRIGESYELDRKALTSCVAGCNADATVRIRSILFPEYVS